MIANNVVALGSTFVFARELDDYGSLGALISYLLILAVAGQAMQVATAREGVLGHSGGRGAARDGAQLDPVDAGRHGRADGALDRCSSTRSPTRSASRSTRGRRRSGIPTGCL